MGTQGNSSQLNGSWSDAFSELDERLRTAPILATDEVVQSYKDIIEASNQLCKAAKSTDEVLRDSYLVSSLTKSIHESAKVVDATHSKFLPDVFAQGIMTQIGENENWSNLAEQIKGVFRYAPGLTFIVGANFTAVPTPVIAKQIQKKERQPKKVLEEKKQPEKVNVIASNAEGVSAVIQTYDVLDKVYQRNGNKPVCFFKFVVNPQSFSKTIENIFHTSFLARDGWVSMALDDDELPVLQPLGKNHKSGNANSAQAVKKIQALVSITKAEWIELIEAYGIKKAILP